MSNEMITQNNQEVIQKLVLSGDLGSMTQQQKVGYYKSFCETLGLNPLTQPFQIIKFQGKEKLYATKDCTEQLRKIYGVSITDLTTNSVNDVFIVTAKGQDKTGKTDCATGAVNIKGLSGDNLANALMKAETKAKRRLTLSICGLGILDETEIETMPPHTTKPVTTDADDLKILDSAYSEDSPGDLEKKMLMSMVYNTDLDESEQEAAFEAIKNCNNYKQFEKIQHRLESRKKTIDQIPNPNQTDINNHLRKVAG